MELVEILALLTFVAVLGVLALLVILLGRKQTAANPTAAAEAAARAMTDALRREVTDPFCGRRRIAKAPSAPRCRPS